MKNYFSSREETARISTIFAMVLAMVAIAYYYLINLATDLRWVMMCGYFFVAIPAAFTLVHGIVAKRLGVVLLGAEFVLLGILGFVAKLLHGINELTFYNYFYATAYALVTIFAFSFADRVAFGKNFLAKWWVALLAVVVIGGLSLSVFVVPDVMVNTMILARNIAFIVVYALAMALGIVFIVKSKNNSFWWAYAVYAFLSLVAYAFQIFYLVRWYNLFLMLAVVSVPYVLMFAVKCEE